jgi:hypothetical protein
VPWADESRLVSTNDLAAVSSRLASVQFIPAAINSSSAALVHLRCPVKHGTDRDDGGGAAPAVSQPVSIYAVFMIQYHTHTVAAQG